VAENSSGKPYHQLRFFNWVLRYFPNKNPRELFWHRDKSERQVQLLLGKVELQLEDRLPQKMNKFNKYTIPEMEYHRVISNKPFLVLIKEK
jgi:hypothetical protein